MIVSPVIVGCLGLIALVGCRGGQSPRGAAMLNLIGIMQVYAEKHEGWFPQSEKGAYDALQKLYPDYISTRELAELAGLSADIEPLIKAVERGEPLNDKLTSWIYHQGLKNSDDYRIALFWERRGGLFSGGKKDPSGGHAVILLSWEIKQIPPSDWLEFLKDQEALRNSALEKHAVERKAP